LIAASANGNISTDLGFSRIHLGQVFGPIPNAKTLTFFPIRYRKIPSLGPFSKNT